ncbi:hypothetical protein [Halobacillus litoralis]|uniref:Uncharacterized protein n=1 Tax=Halobacillus litoralis TaxID=45668 RepID=A0A410MAW6_9BACI|nr:hypothetical protein [Halobacillus litoralis]QAS51828.1 hypothetical protein HLI_06055 [Halobacillus litoralis]
MNHQETKLFHIELLENISHSFRSSNYRLILAEILVSFFYKHTTSPSEIKKHVNEVLKYKDIDEVSLGFVRGIVNSKVQ